MQVQRALKSTILNKLNTSPKGVVIYGARQVGKTTLAKEIIEELQLKTLVVNGDQTKYVDILSSRNLAKIKELVSGYELLLVDEAQRIPEIGISLKIIRDELPDLKLIVTGSSSLDLASSISEPLTGRVWTYKLYPVSIGELANIYSDFELKDQLAERMVYGSYPELIGMSGGDQKREYLQVLSDAYLYKDLLELSGIRNTNKIRDLLKLLAFQVGNEVSLTELGTQLEMGKDTVAKYIDYLEKSFIVFRLSGLNRNLRKEVGKKDKIYFYDLGVRNILIDNLKNLKDRSDVGALWENFLVIERMKRNAYIGIVTNTYFWRTYTGAELDYVEECEGLMSGYEFKYAKDKVKPPKSWGETYTNARFELINTDNWLEFVR